MCTGGARRSSHRAVSASHPAGDSAYALTRDSRVTGVALVARVLATRASATASAASAYADSLLLLTAAVA